MTEQDTPGRPPAEGRALHPTAEPGVPAAADTADGSLRRRIGTVAAASAVALLASQVLSFGQTIALARLLSPTEVGYFAAGSVVTSFVTNFVEGGLRAGLVHREDRLEDAAETVFRATLAVGLVLSLLALVSAPLIGLLFSSHTAGVVAASMAGGIFLFAFTNVPEALLQREFSVKRRLVVGPTVALVFAVVSVTLAATGFGVWSMVIGTYASSTAWVVMLWWICDWRPGRGKPDLGLYREMVRYGAPMAVGLFVEQTVKGVQSVITGRIFGVHSLGLLRYGDRLGQVPIVGIVEVAANSLFPAYSRIAGDQVRFRRAFVHALGLVLAVAIATCGGLLALGEPLVVVVLGPEWRGAGVVLVAMAATSIGAALCTSAEALKGAGRTGLLNWITFTEAVLGIGLVVVLGPWLGLLGVGLSMSLTSLAMGITAVSMARAVIAVRWREVLGVLLPATAVMVVVAVAVRLLDDDVVRASERSVWLGLLLLVGEGVAYLVLYAVGLRVAAPRSYAMLRDVVVSVAGSARARLGGASLESPEPSSASSEG